MNAKSLLLLFDIRYFLDEYSDITIDLVGNIYIKHKSSFYLNRLYCRDINEDGYLVSIENSKFSIFDRFYSGKDILDWVQNFKENHSEPLNRGLEICLGERCRLSRLQTSIIMLGEEAFERSLMYEFIRLLNYEELAKALKSYEVFIKLINWGKSHDQPININYCHYDLVNQDALSVYLSTKKFLEDVDNSFFEWASIDKIKKFKIKQISPFFNIEKLSDEAKNKLSFIESLEIANISYLSYFSNLKFISLLYVDKIDLLDFENLKKIKVNEIIFSNNDLKKITPEHRKSMNDQKIPWRFLGEHYTKSVL